MVVVAINGEPAGALVFDDPVHLDARGQFVLFAGAG